jgi:hypothetical protein
MNQLAENNAAEAAADTLAVEDTNSQFLGGKMRGAKSLLNLFLHSSKLGRFKEKESYLNNY